MNVQDYIAWTDGQRSIYFGVKNFDNDSIASVLRSIQHVAERTSHDIITYDQYLQPLLDPGRPIVCRLLLSVYHISHN